MVKLSAFAKLGALVALLSIPPAFAGDLEISSVTKVCGDYGFLHVKGPGHVGKILKVTVRHGVPDESITSYPIEVRQFLEVGAEVKMGGLMTWPTPTKLAYLDIQAEKDSVQLLIKGTEDELNQFRDHVESARHVRVTGYKCNSMIAVYPK